MHTFYDAFYDSTYETRPLLQNLTSYKENTRPDDSQARRLDVAVITPRVNEFPGVIPVKSTGKCANSRPHRSIRGHPLPWCSFDATFPCYPSLSRHPSATFGRLHVNNVSRCNPLLELLDKEWTMIVFKTIHLRLNFIYAKEINYSCYLNYITEFRSAYTIGNVSLHTNEIKICEI